MCFPKYFYLFISLLFCESLELLVNQSDLTEAIYSYQICSLLA